MQSQLLVSLVSVIRGLNSSVSPCKPRSAAVGPACCHLPFSAHMSQLLPLVLYTTCRGSECLQCASDGPLISATTVSLSVCCWLKACVASTNQSTGWTGWLGCCVYLVLHFWSFVCSFVSVSRNFCYLLSGPGPAPPPPPPPSRILQELCLCHCPLTALC